jgi:hypothetical protein
LDRDLGTARRNAVKAFRVDPKERRQGVPVNREPYG